jgi:hypothetical protein
MENKTGQAGGRGFGGQVLLETDLVLSRSRLSPLDLARQGKAGCSELPALEGGKALLEVGGVVVAEGRIVQRGGRHCFRLDRLMEAADEVAGRPEAGA